MPAKSSSFKVKAVAMIVGRVRPLVVLGSAQLRTAELYVAAHKSPPHTRCGPIAAFHVRDCLAWYGEPIRRRP
jgi:hypothetical protein